MTDKMDFYTVLPSNSCASTQPNNTASSFYVDFENEIHFKGDWDVALTEYHFNYIPTSIPIQLKLEYYNFGNITEQVKFRLQDGKFIYKIHDPSSIPWISLRLVDFKLEITCKGKPFKIRFANLLDAYNWGFSNQAIINSKSTVILADTPIRPNITKDVDYEMIVIYHGISAKEQEIIFYKYIRMNSYDKIKEYFLEHCDYIFEEFKINQNSLVNFKIRPEIALIKLDKILAFDLGFDETEFKNFNQTHLGKRWPRLAKAFSQYFIYSSIVEPILVGESRVPLLRTVWVDPKYEVGDVVYDNVDHPMYIPVAQKSINNIEVQIRTDSGALVNFPEGSKSSITLHFTKKNG